MDAPEQISLFTDFFEKNTLSDILESIKVGQDFVVVDFNSVSEFEPDLANELLEDPENVVSSAERALQELDLGEDVKGFKIRFSNIPESQTIDIRNIRAKDLSKLMRISGIVRQKTDVRPQVTTAKFECPSCGNIINVVQLEAKFREPTRCGCGRKGKFRLTDKELVDAQKIVLEESPEELDGGEQPKRLNIFLKNDLVSPLSEKKTNPGSKISVTGFVKEVPIILNTGGQSTRYDLILESNFVETMEEDFQEVVISAEEKKEILEIASSKNPFGSLCQSLAPSIYGHDKVKEAIILQMLGGVQKVRDDGVVTRGDMHILIIGDPGAGKSQLLKRVTKVAPKIRYVSGKGASGAGLTASVVRDEFLRGWALEAGALVLANKGMVCVDELDKMSREDQSAMHEALEQQTVTISKANIQATLRCETTVLAAANPKFGRFDPYETLARQIELPSTLINRFDLIFPVRDIPDKDSDSTMAEFILNLHKDASVQHAEIDTDLLKKYIAFARQNCKPKLTEAALKEIRDYYVSMRSSGSDEGEVIKAIPISARQLEALVRLAEASAKSRLAKTVEKSDAKKAIELIDYCLRQIGVDPDTGKIDIDRITTGVTASQRSHIVVVRKIIDDMENVVGKVIPIEDVVREASDQGIDENTVNEILEKMSRSGDIFYPKPDQISKL